ncbi:MAG TPA: hypothetical protein VFZ11_06140 [Gemmatimonadaceae bacterium]
MRIELVAGATGAPVAQSPQTSQPTREAIREQVRQSIEQARVDAARAREEMRAALAQAQGTGAGTAVGQGAPVPPVPPVPVIAGEDGQSVIVTHDGRVIEVSPSGDVTIDGDPIAGTSQAPDFPFRPEIPPEAVMISVAFFVMIVLVAVGIPIARAFGRRIDKRSVAAPAIAELAQRLDGIEQAIETVAVEVERISEGQRYSARLMTEMQQAQRIPAGGTNR